MQGPSAHLRQRKATARVNIRPEAPENIKRLLACIDAVLEGPGRAYQKAWKAELDAYVAATGVPVRHREGAVPFDEFHPEATRAAALSLIKQKVMKTYERRFDEVGDQDLPGLTKSYDGLFVTIATKFVDAQIAVAFADNHKAVEAIPPYISGIKEIIARDFQRLYDGRIKEALYKLKKSTVALSLQRIRDAQAANNTWA